jgi:hypothetical protein
MNGYNEVWRSLWTLEMISRNGSASIRRHSQSGVLAK